LLADPDSRIPGTIIFDKKNGATLDLIGAFPRNKTKLEIILGVLEDGNYCTLFNSFEIRRTHHLPGMEIATYISNFLFIGAHFTNKSDIKFNEISVHYLHLDEWLNIRSGFKKIETDPKDFKISIEYELPKSIDVNINSSTKLTVNLTATAPTIKMVQKDVIIRQKAFINFEYNKKASFEKILADSFHFQNFLTLLLQKPSYPKELIGQLKMKGDKKLHPVKIFFQISQLPNEEKELLPIDMLIDYKQIRKKFSTLITSWYANKTKLKTANDPFFSAFYNKHLYTSDKFLYLARSMEAFHRDTIKASATNKVRFSEVYSRYSKIFNSTLKIRSKKIFVEKILKYRNDFTHSNPILKAGNKKFLDVHNITEQLKLIMACALLTENGLTVEELRKSIESSRLYAHIRHKMK